MLANFILETSNDPGNNLEITLAGAPAGRLTFASAFADGATVFYVLDDSVQQEAGIGTFAATAPPTLTRATVLWTSAAGHASPTKLNFAGPTRVYNTLPAEHAIYADAGGTVTLPGALDVPGAATVAGALSVGGLLAAALPPATPQAVVRLGDIDTGSNSHGVWEISPNLRQSQMGNATTSTGGQVFVTFPRDDFGTPVFVGLTAFNLSDPTRFDLHLIGNATDSGFTVQAVDSSGAGLSGLSFFWRACF